MDVCGWCRWLCSVFRKHPEVRSSMYLEGASTGWGAKYGSGLYDANDLTAVYTERYEDALRKAVLKVKVSCPWCSHCLAVRAHPFVSLPTVINTTGWWCAQFETIV